MPLRGRIGLFSDSGVQPSAVLTKAVTIPTCAPNYRIHYQYGGGLNLVLGPH